MSTTVINYTKTDKKVLKRLTDVLGSPVSCEGFDQHMRKSVDKLRKAGVIIFDEKENSIMSLTKETEHSPDTQDNPQPTEGDQSDVREQGQPPSESAFWFDDGEKPLTCCRNYPEGSTCKSLHLGVFGRPSVCKHFNHPLDVNTSHGFVPCPPCISAREDEI